MPSLDTHNPGVHQGGPGPCTPAPSEGFSPRLTSLAELALLRNEMGGAEKGRRKSDSRVNLQLSGQGLAPGSPGDLQGLSRKEAKVFGDAERVAPRELRQKPGVQRSRGLAPPLGV